ncbi:hypothetical protein PAHAL_2G344100 [Panicum hallii]|uniref:Uncharacterized protein n=1 Tax=Panicum hallii TaxID=206008 RepID=A0A2T8KRE5_9POAL|nr:hypothetical protein PAHAL_2G344100 [Panicum hallii]
MPRSSASHKRSCPRGGDQVTAERECTPPSPSSPFPPQPMDRRGFPERKRRTSGRFVGACLTEEDANKLREGNEDWFISPNQIYALIVNPHRAMQFLAGRNE